MIKGVVRLVLGGNMKLRRLAALVLAGVLCLTTFVGCGAKSSDTIATLGNEKVSFGVANFLIKYQKASVDDMYAMYAGMYGVESMWTIDMSGSGSTTEQQFKAEAMNMLHEMYALKTHMADYGVEITEEEKAEIKKAANAFLAANTKEALEEMGATEDIVVEVLTLYTIQAKMFEALTADVDQVVSDEEANMRGYSMIHIDLTGHYDESSQWVKYTEEEIASIKSIALGMNLDLKVKSMEDVAKEQNYTVTKDAYNKEDISMDKTLLAELNKLAEGEVSEMIETDTAIYFLRIDNDVDETATEQNRQAILAEREYTAYEAAVKKLMENDGWKVDTALLNEIDFHNNFTLYKDTEKEDSTENSGATETVDGTESN